MKQERSISFVVTDVKKRLCKRVCNACGDSTDGYYFFEQDGKIQVSIMLKGDVVLMRHADDCPIREADFALLGANKNGE